MTSVARRNGTEAGRLCHQRPLTRRDIEHRVVPDPNFVAAAGVPPTSPAREAVRGIYLLPVSRGAPRLLVPAPGGMVHFSPAFSRDGRRVAYASCKGLLSCDVYVVDLDSSLVPTVGHDG